MDFEIKEQIELSAYRCEITAESNLQSKLNEDTFLINMRDLFTNEIFSIDYKDLLTKYGLSDRETHPSDPDQWLEDSMMKNGGLCVYFNGNNMYMKMLTRCKDSENNVSGFNSSKVEVFFDADKHYDLSYYARILPYLMRDKLIKKDSSKMDPVIPYDTAEGIRPDYNFGSNKGPGATGEETDYFPGKEDKVPKANIKYPEIDYLYVNNENQTNIQENTPLYISDVSSFFANPDTYGGIDYDATKNVKSYLLDTENNTQIDIPYYNIGEGNDILVEYPINDELTAQMYMNTIRQEVRFNEDIKDHRKNRLVLDIDYDNHGIEKISLKRCIVEIDTNNHIKITNPNEIGTEIFPRVTLNGSDITSQILNKTQTDNVLEFDIPSFELNDGATLKVEGWIEDYVTGYTKEEVIIATVGIASKVFSGKQKISISYSGNNVSDGISCRSYMVGEFTSFSNCKANKPMQLVDGERGISQLVINNPNSDRSTSDIISIIVQGSSDIQIEYVISDQTERMNNYVSTGNIYFYLKNIPLGPVDVSATINGGGYNWNTINEEDLPYVHIWTNAQEAINIVVFNCLDQDSGVPDCTYYKGLNNTSTAVKSDEHILMTYEDETKNEFGLSYFRIYNPNTNSAVTRATSDVIKIEVYRNDVLVNTITNGNETSTSDTYRKNGYDTSKYISDGQIDFSIKNIDPSIITVKVTINPSLTGAKWNHAESTPLEWINNPFIPKKYEQLEDYVIFSHSYLNLDGAYVGIKAVYAPGVKAINGATLDCELLVGCTQTGDESSYIKLQNANNSHEYPAIHKTMNYWRQGNDIPKTNEFGDEIQFNPDCPTIFYVPQEKASSLSKTTILKNANNSVLGYKEELGYVGFTTIDNYPNLEILKFDYDFSTNNPEINLKNGETYTFDGNGKIVNFKKLSAGNECTIHFKSGGEYLFEDVSVGTDFNIVIDDIHESSCKFVRIACKNRFVTGNKLNINNHQNNSELKSFMIYAEGDGMTDNTAPISFAATSDASRNFGVLVAPYGEVYFANTIVWTGGIWAQKLTMQNGCIFLSDNMENIWGN